MKQIEAEGGEILLKNSHGDIVIIPKKDKNKIESLIKDGCGDCIDSFVETLPVMSNYAKDGSVIPKGSKIKYQDSKGNTSYIDINSPEYEEMYSNGQIATYDERSDTFIVPELAPTIFEAEPSELLKLRRKIQEEYTKDKFIDESLPKFSRSIGVSADNLAEGTLKQYEKNLNDRIAKELLSSNPRKGKKSENNLEWYNSFSPKERELIQGSSYSKKFLPAERAYNQYVGNQAKEEGIISNFSSAENIKRTGQGLSERGRLFPNAENNIESWVNPFVIAGDMAKGLSEVPTDIKEGNYGQAAIDIGVPLATGAIGGLGTKNVSQFLNNTFNPLAGTKDLVNNLGNKYLPNAYKLNPKALKEVQEKILVRARPVGQNPNINMAESLRAKQAAGEELKWYQKKLLNPQTDPQIIAREKYFGQWFADNPSDLDFYINPGTRNFADDAQIEILKARMPKSEASKYSVKNFEDAKKLSNLHDTEFILPKDIVQQLERHSVDDLPKLIKEYNEINKPHWLKGYKEIDVPKSNFKSEIDWGKWNKEIPENKALMQEYNAIEQQAKADDTWMKNPDGSDFDGTPEQFIQQNSENFKKAYPKGYKTVYRGLPNENPLLLEKENFTGVFTGDKNLAKGYGKNLYELGLKNSKNSVSFNANGDDWLDLKFANRDIATQQKNIDFNKKYLNDLITKEGSSERVVNMKENILRSEKALRENKNALNNQKYQKLTNSFKDKSVVSTDDLAHYLEKEKLDNIQINNILDGEFGDINISNQVSGNYLKSLKNNNGMFDMTNPNIYKSLTAGALGTQYLKNQEETPEEFNNGGQVKKPKKRLIKAKK